MEEKHQKPLDMGTSSITLDSDASNGPNILDQLAGATYKAVFMTPEIIFESGSLTQFWPRHEWK
ncbi:hypothetical protein BGZ54_008778, partial [Gamsiella multidivaricata]